MIKRQFSKIMLLCLSTFLALGSQLQAENTRIEMLETSLSRMDEMRLDAKYASIDSNEMEQSSSADKLESDTYEQSLSIDSEVKRYQSTFQLLKDVSTDMVELYNSSGWLVNSRDIPKLYLWKPRVDTIVVMQDTSWFFSRNKYRLVNTITGDVVAADLKLNPYANKVPTIKNIDSYTRTIELTDGTKWKITSWDDSIYSDKSTSDPAQRRWLATDGIIVGANASYFGGPFILINVNVNKVARAWLVH